MLVFASRFGIGLNDVLEFSKVQFCTISLEDVAMEAFAGKLNSKASSLRTWCGLLLMRITDFLRLFAQIWFEICERASASSKLYNAELHGASG